MSLHSFAQQVFPPPSYITLPNVGVDISDTSLKYIQFIRKHARDTFFHLGVYGDVSIPEGVVERGSVHDVAKLTEVLKEVRKELPTEFIRVSLPEERAYLFETTIKSGTPLNEIRGLLEFRLEENVPLSPRDAYFDYDIVEVDDEEDVLRVVVAAYARDTINHYYEACREAGLTPLSFEIEAQAIARALVGKELRGTNMIVDFGKTRTGVGIVHKGVLMYTSTIDIGGREISAALRKVLGESIAESELTKLKNTKGLSHTEENEKARTAIMSVLSSIIDELGVRIHYWNTRSIERGERDIEKIILCGGSSNLAGLPEHLTTALNIETSRASVWHNAFSTERFVPPIEQRYAYGYATAIGLALCDFVEDNYD